MHKLLYYSSRLFFLAIVLACAPAYSHDEFIDVIALAKPAIVTIEANKKSTFFKSNAERERDKVLGDYADFFKEELDDIPARRHGSGFIIHSTNTQTWILTAAHVVESSSKITIELADGKALSAELLNIDRASDVALIRVDQGELPFLQINTLPLKEGQSVIGIGAAFGLSVSTSQGIVSALDVRLTKSTNIGLVQTDVSVNPGSSGGALLDSNGKVVGLITKIYSNTGNFSGSSFALPGSILQKLLDQWL